MKIMKINREEARRLLLAYQELYPPRRLQGKRGIMQFLQRVRCMQQDPLDIVGNNPLLVLQSRVKDMRKEWLAELLYRERKLFDGWDKMMSINLVKDWPYFRRIRESGYRRFEDEAVLDKIRAKIRQEGPLSSPALAGDKALFTPSLPARAARLALESMYLRGELIVHHRVHSRRVFDFACNHIPGTILNQPDPLRQEEEYREWRIFRRIQSIGLIWEKSGDAWLGIRGLKAADRREAINRLLEKKALRQLSVEGSSRRFLIPEGAWKIFTRRQAQAPEHQAALIAPLDNFLWDRELIQFLFDFRYRWEVYKPAAEREYGYYVLPILYGDRFVARFEPGKEGQALVIKNWWWEEQITVTAELEAALARALEDFLRCGGFVAIKLAKSLEKKQGLAWMQSCQP